MDFVHEDLSLMSQEMDRWRALHKVKVRPAQTTQDIPELFLPGPIYASSLQQYAGKSGACPQCGKTACQ